MFIGCDYVLKMGDIYFELVPLNEGLAGMDLDRDGSVLVSLRSEKGAALVVYCTVIQFGLV